MLQTFFDTLTSWHANHPELVTTNDEDLYFSDGSVILSAEDADQNQILYFRVHKSVLAKNSLVFEDI